MGKSKKENMAPGSHDDFDGTIIKSHFGFEKGELTGANPSLIFTLKTKKEAYPKLPIALVVAGKSPTTAGRSNTK